MSNQAKTLPDLDPEQVSQRAADLMAGGHFGCSEAVVLAFQDALGPDWLPPAAVALSSNFRGGQGGAGCICGALAGGQMVLGSIYGYHGDADGRQDPEAVKAARERSRELHDQFKAQNRAVCCRVLTKNLTPGSPEAKANCVRLVKSAAGLAGGLIGRPGQEKD